TRITLCRSPRSASPETLDPLGRPTGRSTGSHRPSGHHHLAGYQRRLSLLGQRPRLLPRPPRCPLPHHPRSPADAGRLVGHPRHDVVRLYPASPHGRPRLSQPTVAPGFVAAFDALRQRRRRSLGVVAPTLLDPAPRATGQTRPTAA